MNSRKVRSAIAIFLIGLAFLLTAQPNAFAQAKAGVFQSDPTTGWKYILRKPAVTMTKAPLVVVLHGMGGDAKSMSVQWGTQPGMEKMYVLAPQGPRKDAKSTWGGGDDATSLIGLIDRLTKENNIDPDRIAVVGYSAGTYLAMRLVRGNPGKFAACVIMGGSGGKSASGAAAKTKFYLLSGEQDGSFNEKKANVMAESLIGEGAFAMVEIVPGANHGSLYAKNQGATKWLVSVLEGPGTK
jgi:poly(3-hydroxybutyrate) depolymerase